MHFLKIHFLRCINAVGCVKKRHALRCIQKMQAILSVYIRMVWFGKWMLGCLGKGWSCWANGGRFEINKLLFADDTALVADSEEKLCRLVSEFGTVCERRKLRVNVGKSKVMRCSRYSNGDRIHVIQTFRGSILF